MRRAIRYAEGREGSISFAVKDKRGRFYGYRQRRTVPSASVFKAMMLAAYLRHPRVRDRRLRGWEKDLLRAMIRRSDNDATTRLLERIGEGPIWRLARDAHMRNFHFTRPWGLTRVNAADQTRYMYNFEDFIPERHERYARYNLARVVPSQRWGIGEVELDGWRKFFKGGWGTGTGRVSHQVVFLDKGERRVSLAVMTEYSPSHSYSTQTLKGIMRRLLRGLP